VTGWIRLRQVALVAADLDAAVDRLRSTFGLEVAYRDPEVAVFGLNNALLPVGSQFIEVVSPFRPDTAAGRQMERMGGDGGYMVICHTDSLESQAEVRQRAASLDVRVAFEHQTPGSSIVQFHPGDTGGSFLEVDHQDGADDPWGRWAPAGPEWQSAVRTTVVDGITGVTVQSPDPDLTASKWAAILGVPVADRTIQLENGRIDFVDGSVHSLVKVDLSGPGGPTELVLG
jgi:catechol 2,3-dioxygenase-like lactoylglutathione lyase family enzyme